MKQLIYIIFGFIIGVVLCNTTNIPCISQKQADSVAVKVDTVIEFFTVFDTETVYVDQIKEVPKYIPRTVVINDTAYIEKIQQVYRDTTPSYNIEIGAVELNYYKLDVHHKDTLRFRDTINMQIPIQKQRKKPFSVGIGVGAGYSPRSKTIEPMVGVSLTYDIIRF